MLTCDLSIKRSSICPVLFRMNYVHTHQIKDTRDRRHDEVREGDKREAREYQGKIRDKRKEIHNDRREIYGNDHDRRYGWDSDRRHDRDHDHD